MMRIRANRKILVVAIVALAVVTAGAAAFVVAQPFAIAQATPSASASPSLEASPSPSPTPEESLSPSPTDTAEPSPTPSSLPADWAYADLDGVAAPQAAAHRLPMAIMIDDNTVARPQSGISSASIVYQAYADGGEDRYMFVFQEGMATDIGPVRSARPYYVYWADEYKALYGHFGGDANSLRVVIPANAKNIYNMDDLNGGACPYHRIDTRAAPHNAYTNSAALISCAAQKAYPATFQNLPTRTFKDDMPVAQRPASQTVSITYRTGIVGYQYDPASDSYLRIIGGAPEVDPANGNKVYARTVVIMYQAYGTDPHALDEASRPYVYNVGSGKATIFIEGKAIAATWKKTANTTLTRFYDSSGHEIPFVRGEIFMQSIPTGTAVSVK
jgi:hypothetical protein